MRNLLHGFERAIDDGGGSKRNRRQKTKRSHHGWVIPQGGMDDTDTHDHNTQNRTDLRNVGRKLVVKHRPHVIIHGRLINAQKTIQKKLFATQHLGFLDGVQPLKNVFVLCRHELILLFTEGLEFAFEKIVLAKGGNRQHDGRNHRE